MLEPEKRAEDENRMPEETRQICSSSDKFLQNCNLKNQNMLEKFTALHGRFLSSATAAGSCGVAGGCRLCNRNATLIANRQWNESQNDCRAHLNTSSYSACALVDLDVPLAVLLPLLLDLGPVETLALGDPLQHFCDPRHHALEAAEIDVRALVHAVEDLVRILLDLILDVHLAAVCVRLLSGERVVEAEVVRVRFEDRLPLVVVEEGVRVG